jgi:hypothetical protein
MDMDIILFSGNDWWPSRLIEWVTDSKYSHVALLVHDPPTCIDKETKGNGPYLFESGEEIGEDGKAKYGVQMNPWSKVMETNKGCRIYKRRLEGFSGDVQWSLKRAWDKTNGASYDFNLLDFLQLLFHKKIEEPNSKKFVCSAYVTYLLVELGLLSKDTDWTLFSPKCFAPGSYIDEALKKGKAKLGAIERIQ